MKKWHITAITQKIRSPEWINLDTKLIERKLSATPVHLQIKKQLREYIVSNKLEPDAPIPNVKQIAVMGGVSVRTAGYGDVILDWSRPKKGTFVAHNVFSNMGQRRMVGINCHHLFTENGK